MGHVPIQIGYIVTVRQATVKKSQPIMFLVIGGVMTVPKVVFPVIPGLVHVVWGRILYRRLNIKDNDAALPDLFTLFSTFLNISSASEYETLNPDGTCSFEVITSGDKSCWFTNDYKRQCDDPRIDLMGKTAQECLEQGSTHHGWSVLELSEPGLTN